VEKEALRALNDHEAPEGKMPCAKIGNISGNVTMARHLASIYGGKGKNGTPSSRSLLVVKHEGNVVSCPPYAFSLN
jgi:hypothetical protein